MDARLPDDERKLCEMRCAPPGKSSPPGGERLQVVDKNVTSCSPGLTNIVGLGGGVYSPGLKCKTMQPPDFLHKNAETNLCEHYIVAGTVFRLATNCEPLLTAARESFLQLEMPPDAIDFSLRFWVDDTSSSWPPWPNPYVRGLDHLVFAGFDGESSVLVNLQTRHVIGRFSAAMGADMTHWRTVVFPVLLSILAGSIGLVELHASCVARDRRGLVLIGSSCSGKSTLALAFSHAGFRLLSDDRTFCSLKQGRLRAYGLPRPLKLRREAAVWFEEFRGREPTDLQNGERVFRCEPPARLGQHGVHDCEPQRLVFLERQQEPGFCLTPMTRSQVKSRIEMDLLAEATDAIQRQTETIDRLMELPYWRLRYGGRPQEIVAQLVRQVEL